MLTSKQRAYLRSLANSLETTLIIGKGGVTENIVKQAEDLLTAHEIFKGRVLENSSLTTSGAADDVAEKTRSDVVQTIGSVFVLYRGNPKLDKQKRIRL